MVSTWTVTAYEHNLQLVSGSQDRSHNLLSSIVIGADQVLSPPTYSHSDGSLSTQFDNLATLHNSILMTEATLFS